MGHLPDQESLSMTQAVRLLAVANRINLQAARSEQHFVEELEGIVTLAVPYLAHDRPNLVVLSELLGLPLALVGRRGILARHMQTSNAAMSVLALSYAGRMLHYRHLYPGISLVRSLLLSLSDVLYRPFVTTLSHLAAKHAIYLSATTITPQVRRSTSPADIRRFGSPGAACVYLPESQHVYNTGFLWGPDGELIGTTDKVFLTESEKSVLDLTPGDLERVRVFNTPIGNIGLAISLDAFTSQYLSTLDRLGARIVIQNDANDQLWAAPSKTSEWQPQEWLNSVLGSLQDEYPHLLYNVCPMQVGNFFDITFDGQSTITTKSEQEPDCNFVGNEGFVHTVTGKPMTGKILAMAPWAALDPIATTPGITLNERRAVLGRMGQQLLPGGKRANRYPEAVIWSDVDVPLP